MVPGVVLFWSLVFAAGFRDLSWSELVAPVSPLNSTPGPVDPLGGRSEQQSEDLNLVADLDGLKIRLPGFMVPLTSDEVGLLEAFFLVPYFGACIHTPPPPPNQLVYVKLTEAFELESLGDAFWVSGTLRTRGFGSLMGQAGYTLEDASVTPYEWED